MEAIVVRSMVPGTAPAAKGLDPGVKVMVPLLVTAIAPPLSGAVMVTVLPLTVAL